jgi:hypothetical protein
VRWRSARPPACSKPNASFGRSSATATSPPSSSRSNATATVAVTPSMPLAPRPRRPLSSSPLDYHTGTAAENPRRAGHPPALKNTFLPRLPRGSSCQRRPVRSTAPLYEVAFASRLIMSPARLEPSTAGTATRRFSFARALLLVPPRTLGRYQNVQKIGAGARRAGGRSLAQLRIVASRAENTASLIEK